MQYHISSRVYPQIAGYTLVELLVVIALISIFGTLSFAAFTRFQYVQNLQQNAQNLGSVMQTAKAQTLAQIKPAVCGANPLNGYEVHICGLTGSTCYNTSNASYELSVSCGTQDVTKVIKTYILPSTLSFSDAGTSTKNIQFEVLTGQVIGPGDILIKDQYGSTITVAVEAQGAITVHW